MKMMSKMTIWTLDVYALPRLPLSQIPPPCYSAPLPQDLSRSGLPTLYSEQCLMLKVASVAYAVFTG